MVFLSVRINFCAYLLIDLLLLTPHFLGAQCCSDKGISVVSP